MNHRENILSETDSGQVIRCLCCDTFSVEFGNTVLQQLTLPEFHRLVQTVKSLSPQSYFEHGKKRLYLSVVKNRALMGLTVAEFYEFTALLEGAAERVPWLKEV